MLRLRPRLHRRSIQILFTVLPFLIAAVRSDGQAIETAMVSLPADVTTTTSKPASDGMAALGPEMQGDLSMVHGNYVAAIHAYDKVSPRTAAIWNKTGMAYHHLFALDTAGQDYEKAIRLDPQFAPAYNNLGAVYYGKREYALAEKAYKAAIQHQPKMAVSYLNLGTAYFAELKDKQGSEMYRQALEVDPNAFGPGSNNIQEASPRQQRVTTAYSLAKIYASEGRNQEAMASLHQAVSAGFRDRKHLLKDKEFAALRESPEFRQLLVDEPIE